MHNTSFLVSNVWKQRHARQIHDGGILRSPAPSQLGGGEAPVRAPRSAARTPPGESRAALVERVRLPDEQLGLLGGREMHAWLGVGFGVS